MFSVRTLALSPSPSPPLSLSLSPDYKFLPSKRGGKRSHCQRRYTLRVPAGECYSLVAAA